MDSIPHKTCTMCNESKPLSDFHPHRGNRDGHRNQCKACRCAYFRDRYETNSAYRDHHLSRNRDLRNKRYHTDATYKATELARVAANRVRFADRRKRYARYWRELPHARPLMCVLNNRRRARKRQNGGAYTQIEWDQLCAFYDHRCLCCKECKRLTVDHVVPISCGGSNAIENIQPLCMDCNRRKGAKTIDYRS